MIKKTLYPKTERVRVKEYNCCEITEKLDGSNLCIFKLNDKIYFAQRNNIIAEDEIEENKDKLYSGLYGWATDHLAELKVELNEGSCICGEWLGMGQIKYTVDKFSNRYYMFAKANVSPQYDIYNLHYYHELFIYPFVSQKLPNFISEVPVVATLGIVPSKTKLDEIYSKYIEKEKRNVEGFIVNYEDSIKKYVRFKRGKLTEHVYNDE